MYQCDISHVLSVMHVTLCEKPVSDLTLLLKNNQIDIAFVAFGHEDPEIVDCKTNFWSNSMQRVLHD